MMLLAPAALWSLAALTLPLAIHLWRRPPRTVRLGSLRFLQGGARRWQNLRWREYALLLARLGLLAGLALLLARPFWRQPPPSRPQRWVLLDPAAALAGPSRERLAALQAAGYDTRLLAARFPAIARPPADPSAPAPDVWSLLREADATLPVGSSLAIFSPGRLASINGIRPVATRCRVEWINTPAAPFVSGPPPAHLATARPLTIQIVHDTDRAADARYVAAALRAVSRTGQRPLTVGVASTASPAATADWIFWLSAQPVPPATARGAAHVLDDASAALDADTTPGWIVPAPGATGATALISPVRLWQRGPASAGAVVWTDGFGQPLLTRADDARGTRWHFASRFDPAWNDLPLGTALPASLRALLDADAEPAATNDDRRLLDPKQCLPNTAGATARSKIAFAGAEIDLWQPIWLLVVLCFCLERILSHRQAARVPATVAASPGEPAFSR